MRATAALTFFNLYTSATLNLSANCISATTMSGEEKIRVSGDITRADTSSPVLPTVNPQVDKPAPAKASLHPIFYVV